MVNVRFGEAQHGVRLGLVPPSGELTAGGPVALELVAENVGYTPVWLFGFKPNYPRSLRVSPPKPERPWVRVSFGDVSVLHPPDAFVRVAPGERVSGWLDLSFAIDRRGAGIFDVGFVYEAIRGMGGIRAFSPSGGLGSERVSVTVGQAAALMASGIDGVVEDDLDGLLLAGDPRAIDRLRILGHGGASYVARRFARVLGGASDALLGWRALDLLALLGPAGLAALGEARQQMPHAESALAFAQDWLAFRRGSPPPPEHAPFVHALEQLAKHPERRGHFRLSWSAYDSPIHGANRLEVLGSGDRIVTSRPPGSAVPSTRRTQLAPHHLTVLLEALVASGPWLLRPLRPQGSPDEPRPSLEIQLDSDERLTRKLAMWNGEWRQGPASRLASLLDQLAATARHDSFPPPR
jgi:hypothetical protein